MSMQLLQPMPRPTVRHPPSDFMIRVWTICFLFVVLSVAGRALVQGESAHLARAAAIAIH
jgi:hypothetical protein